MFGPYELFALLIGLTAVFAWVNNRYVKLPLTIGLMAIGLGATILIVLFDLAVPGVSVEDRAEAILRSVDFQETLMQGMLGFLLFAGALHVDLTAMLQRRYSIALMATVGVTISTFLVGTGAYYLFDLLGFAVPYMACLVLGAIISPTDPIAVLGVLKIVKVPPQLEAKIAGESLFNDGVGVVVFTIVVAIAFGGDAHADTSTGGIVLLFVSEALGGLVLGIVTGYLVRAMLRRTTDQVVQVLLTLALVTVTYTLAARLHVSPLIAVVAAGLFIGRHKHDPETIAEHGEMHDFWTLIDEILNAVLFLLIGFEVLVINVSPEYLAAALVIIPLALAARFTAVGLSIAVLSPFRPFTKGAVWVLTWGGLRGGISVALALSLPDSPFKDLLLSVTYGVVVFSVLVQGLTVSAVIRRVVPQGPHEPE